MLNVFSACSSQMVSQPQSRLMVCSHSIYRIKERAAWRCTLHGYRLNVRACSKVHLAMLELLQPSCMIFVTGVHTMSTADVLAELAYLNPRNKRKGKGGRQPAMDPRLDPNVDPKKAKRILANRLSAARSKMKQKSHVEVSLHAQSCFW